MSRAMTTNELIEKYGIGHNCLSDAYALGMMHGLDALENAVELAEKKARAEGYQQAESDYHKQTEKDRQSAYECGYEQGRADAIEEFRAECESASYIPIGYGYYVTDMKSIRKIAELLKEKKK